MIFLEARMNLFGKLAICFFITGFTSTVLVSAATVGTDNVVLANHFYKYDHSNPEEDAFKWIKMFVQKFLSLNLRQNNKSKQEALDVELTKLKEKVDAYSKTLETKTKSKDFDVDVKELFKNTFKYKLELLNLELEDINASLDLFKAAEKNVTTQEAKGNELEENRKIQAMRLVLKEQRRVSTEAEITRYTEYVNAMHSNDENAKVQAMQTYLVTKSVRIPFVSFKKQDLLTFGENIALYYQGYVVLGSIQKQVFPDFSKAPASLKFLEQNAGSGCAARRYGTPKEQYGLDRASADMACTIASSIAAALNVKLMRDIVSGFLVKQDKDYVYFKFPVAPLLETYPGFKGAVAAEKIIGAAEKVYKVKKDVHQGVMFPLGNREMPSVEELSDFDLWFHWFSKAFYSYLVEAGELSQDTRAYAPGVSLRVPPDYTEFFRISTLFGTRQIQSSVPNDSIPVAAVAADGGFQLVVHMSELPFADYQGSSSRKLLIDLRQRETYLSALGNYRKLTVKVDDQAYIELFDDLHQTSLYFDGVTKKWIHFDNQAKEPKKELSVDEVNALLKDYDGITNREGGRKYLRVTFSSESIVDEALNTRERLSPPSS